VPNYDCTVSVIDVETFRVIKTINVAPNLQCMAVDAHRGLVYVSSRGDYADINSAIYVIDAHSDEVVKEIPLPCSAMTLQGDSLYVVSRRMSWDDDEKPVSYIVYDLGLEKVVTESFITDGTDADITMPYGIAVNPENGDILVTDAKDYVTPGRLNCYTRAGVRRWAVTTGDIPGHIAFVEK